MGFTSQTPFSNLAQIMGHLFVLGERRKLVKAVFMIGIAGSLRAGTPFRGIARSHARETREQTRERSGECAGSSRVHSRLMESFLAMAILPVSYKFQTKLVKKRLCPKTFLPGL